MTAADTVANRAFLKAYGRAAHAPSALLLALMLINAGGAAAFAWALTLVLTGKAALTTLAGLVVALAVRAVAAWAASRVASRHALRVKAQLRREGLLVVLGRGRGDAASIGEATGAVVDEIEAIDG